MPAGAPHGDDAPDDESGQEDLLQQVLERAHRARDEQQRWQLLLDAVVSMAADLSLDELLSRVVQIAADLAGARYAALGVLGNDPRQRLRTFITHGLTEEQTARLGPPPEGHGILGLIIDHPEPLRLRELSGHPASYGFPPGHPPMSSFLGVPVRAGGKDLRQPLPHRQDRGARVRRQRRAARGRARRRGGCGDRECHPSRGGRTP